MRKFIQQGVGIYRDSFVLLDKRSHIRHQPIIIFLADLNYISFTAVALLRQFWLNVATRIALSI